MMREIPGGLMFDGHDAPRADLFTAARQYLTDAGMPTLDVDDMLIDRQGLIARTWWGGDEIGFVQESHPAALPVTVIHVQRRTL